MSLSVRQSGFFFIGSRVGVAFVVSPGGFKFVSNPL